MTNVAHMCNPRRRSRLLNLHFSESEEKQQPQSETMSSWLERQTSSHSVQLAAVALASGAVVASAIFGSQALRQEKKVSKLKASIPELNENHHAEVVGLANTANGLFY